MSNEWIASAFERIKEYFVDILEFFEDMPDIIEGFFSSFFGDIKQILEKIDSTEKLNSIGNSMKGSGEDLKVFASETFGKVKDGPGGILNDIGGALGLG
jgi:hypothetical protein